MVANSHVLKTRNIIRLNMYPR